MRMTKVVRMVTWWKFLTTFRYTRPSDRCLHWPLCSPFHGTPWNNYQHTLVPTLSLVHLWPRQPVPFNTTDSHRSLPSTTFLIRPLYCWTQTPLKYPFLRSIRDSIQSGIFHLVRERFPWLLEEIQPWFSLQRNSRPPWFSLQRTPTLPTRPHDVRHIYL